MIIIAILYRLLEIKLKQNLFENGNGGIGFCLGGNQIKEKDSSIYHIKNIFHLIN